jgi:EAL domain-containing protein (putative c-di-GMP-specific phosphodiesterase class I)
MRPGGEQDLLKLLPQLPESRAGFRVVWFRLSRLRSAYRSSKHVQLTINVFDQALSALWRRIFVFRDNDVIVVAKGISKKAIDNINEVVRYLFNDDPVAKEQTSHADFCAVYDLEVDAVVFERAVREACADRPKLPQEQRAQAVSAPTAEAPTLDLADWGSLSSAIDRINLSSFVRRQPIWSLVPGSAPRRIFDELFISIDELRKAIGPQCNLLADRQVFQLVTRRLDTHVLRTLVREHSDGARRISININLATLSSSAFAEFERRLPAGWHDRLILEIQLADMWSDLPAFLSFIKHADERGYMCCVDGVIYKALPFMNFRRMQVQFMKLVWDPGMVALKGAALEELRSAVAECNPQRIILTRCGDRAAIEFGQSLGIGLFQGWYPDRQT